MSTKEFMDEIIRSRMDVLYTNHKENGDMVAEQVESQYEMLLDQLDPEQQKILKVHEDAIFDKYSENYGFYYRAGLNDGILLARIMKKGILPFIDS